MPSAKSKTASGNGSAAKSKPSSKSSPATSRTTTPLPPKPDVDDASASTGAGSSRPNKATYDAEQEKLKAEIDAVQLNLTQLKEKISLTAKDGPGNERRTALRAELDGIRGQQSNNKTSRGKILDQVKAHQENVQKKVKDLQAARVKTPFKSVAEVDARIKDLEKQVESGDMKLADEKRALQEISQCKRTRRTVESFEAEQGAIEAERATLDELRKQLDDPESKAVSERYDAIKAELDELKRLGDEAFAGRSKLFDERTALQGQLDTLYGQKRESAQKYREANDRYWNKVNEDRARRAEKARAQRAADEDLKKKELSERLREEAEQPAFQVQIEDCQTLIDYFSGKGAGNTSSVAGTPLAKTDVVGVPKLEIRQVDQQQSEGLVARKKKGEEEENYFVAKGKGKGKKSGTKANGTPDGAVADASTPGNVQLNMPLSTLTALLSLSIPPPASSVDVPRTIEDLKTKKAWYEANQARVTAENIAKAEASIIKLTNGNKAEAISADIAPPNGGGVHPPEPAPTPAKVHEHSIAVSSNQVVENLESVQEAASVDDGTVEAEAVEGVEV